MNERFVPKALPCSGVPVRSRTVPRDDGLEIDLVKREIRRGGRAVAVQRRVYDLIAFLYGTAGRAVSRDELLRTVWSDVKVTEASLNQAVRAARRAIGDDPTEPRRILTLRGFGYRWVSGESPATPSGLPEFGDDTFEREEARLPTSGAWLFVVAGADGLAAPHAAEPLEEVDEVTIGRAPQTSVVREGRRIAIGAASPTMSRKHARILRTPEGRMVVEDGGSKNGTSIDDRRVDRAELRDGDWISCGPLLLRFRTGLSVGVPGEATIDPWPVTLSPALRRALGRGASVLEDGGPVWLSAHEGADVARIARALHQALGRTGRFVSLRGGLGTEREAQAALTQCLAAADGGTLHVARVDLLPGAVVERLAALLEPDDAHAPPPDVALVVSGPASSAAAARTLGALEVVVPPLAARVEDLGLALEALAEGEAQVPAWSPRALHRLATHDWRGDERELARVVRAVRASAGEGPVELDHLLPVLSV